MARPLEAILAELNPQYQGSESILNTRLNAIPGETDAGIAQADAKLAQANEGIVNAARRRGTGIALGGIPVGEQAKYAATDYAPAIANLKASGAQKELTLQESLQQLGREKRSQAQSIFDSEAAREFQQQQLAEQQRQFNEQLAESRRAASAAAGSGSYSLGGGASAVAATKTNTVEQVAYNDVKTRLAQSNERAVVSDYLATLNSADRGNAKDKLKIQMYTQLRPDLFTPQSIKYYTGATARVGAR